MTEIPEFVRRAIEAQGKVDPADVEAAIQSGGIPEEETPQSPASSGPAGHTEPEPLFDVPGGNGHARRSDPAESHLAARSTGDLRDSQRAVLELLREIGPASDERIERAYMTRWGDMGWPRQSPSGLRTRRRELTDVALVVDTGARTVTASGRSTAIWKAAAG